MPTVGGCLPCGVGSENRPFTRSAATGAGAGAGAGADLPAGSIRSRLPTSVVRGTAGQAARDADESGIVGQRGSPRRADVEDSGYRPRGADGVRGYGGRGGRQVPQRELFVPAGSHR